MLSRRLGVCLTKPVFKPPRTPPSWLVGHRNYARSRFEERNPGTSRSRPNLSPRDPRTRPQREDSTYDSTLGHEQQPSVSESAIWEASQRPPAGDPEEGMRRLLMDNDLLIVERQIEMLNIFIGFEQANKYVITNEREETLGYIAEEPRGFLSQMSRQVFRTHRPFRAIVMDSAGSPILWLRRPFAFINSRMYVQRLQDYNSYTPEGEPVMDTFAEAQQIWHPWRRKYDLFLKHKELQILSTTSDPQPEPEPDPYIFHQFARIDSGFLAWYFGLQDQAGQHIASVDRTWRGIGREVFTDTGRYFIRFGSLPYDPENPLTQSPPSSRVLTLEERAAVLAMAVNIDFDYFSRHSNTGSGTGLWMWSWGADDI
ncbi:hypothetical protein EIP91_001041 [Steccherinum ochraceum]|uniref:Phospholipid scramblase n=1 Tax=Steccherinum ochraceum TaxID=92696 RepID=A0A4V2MWL1_9APHY|nr:hypothetical protein EIP91_001041 [Steccherinum ochraceum]